MNSIGYYLSKDNTDCFYDTVKLFLSTVFGLALGLNAKMVLGFLNKIVSSFSDNQIIMLSGTVLIAILFEIVINKIPECILDVVFDKLNLDGFIKRVGIFQGVNSYIILATIRVLNYIFVLLVASFMVISVFEYGEEDGDFFYNKFSTYSISKNIVTQMIDSDYMQYFIRKNEVYNGVNMEKAMESDSEIEYEAKRIVENSKSDLEKVKRIYNWVGTNIMYDDDLAKNIADKKIDDVFGAKYAFYNRSGVCFEFATLFGAMTDAIGLPVRVVMGNAYNGVEFGPHAWNEVYLEDEEKWINIDPTFWGHSSSFNSSDFDIIHEKERIAWDNTID